MKRLIYSLLLAIPLICSGQGARIQPGGVPTPVPIYDMRSVSNLFYKVLVDTATNISQNFNISNLPIATNIPPYGRIPFVNPSNGINYTARFDTLQLQIGLSAFYSLYDSNAVQYAVNNQMKSVTDLNDLSGLFSELEANNEIWTNFVDGILFQPRFGATTSLLGRTVVGIRTNYTKDLWGANIQSGLTLQLPNSLSNVTVVAMFRQPVINGSSASSKGQLWSLANTNTKSSIVSAASGSGLIQVQETYRLEEWAGANNGSYSNLFTPLWMFQYLYDEVIGMAGQPMTLGWQRDINANWRMYMDTVPGHISLNNGGAIYASPTNATDLMSTFQIGYDVTNSPGWGASSGTNFDLASVFIFSTTNVAAITAGYKAAMWALNTDSAEFWYTDSRMSPQGFEPSSPPVKDPGYYYSQRLNPQIYYRNYGQGGAKAGDFDTFFVANGGFNALTNMPRAKIKNLKATFAMGINDVYPNARTDGQLFIIWTNIFREFNDVGAQIRFCDIYQLATNSSFYVYDLSKETNAFNASLRIRTNFAFPYKIQYIPLRDLIAQSVIQTNGLFSTDGVHINSRTNPLAQQMIGDFIASPIIPFYGLTNTAIGPF